MVFFFFFLLAVDKRHIVRATMKFEAEHEECLCVCPYMKNDEVVVHLYVYVYESGIPMALKTVAQEFFEPMRVKLEWSDLYNDAYNVLNVTSIEYPSGKPNRLEASQVDEIDEVINKHLYVFSKHRNITALQPAFKITNSVQTAKECIAVYVLGKGNIPLGESAIPDTVGSYPVDIVNGFFVRTADPEMPINAHKQKEFLCSGASIGVKDEKSSGTLGAIVEDETTGTLYALSCDHVMNHDNVSEIVYPGFDVYLNSLHYYLDQYNTIIGTIINPDGKLEKISADILEDPEKMKMKFNSLKTELKAKIDSRELENDRRIRILKGQSKHLKVIEEEFHKFSSASPRAIGNYSVGVRSNVLSRKNSDKEYYIDAAISELTEVEVRGLKSNGLVEIIDTVLSPSDKCVPATMQAMMNVEKVCKSGAATGFTTASGLVSEVGSSMLPAMHIRQQGQSPWFDSDPAIFTKKEAQSQRQESSSPPEVSWLKSCLCIPGKPEKPFSSDGDSGAVVFVKDQEDGFCPGLGIIFGKFLNAYFVLSLASPLQVALEKLSQKVSDSRPGRSPCALRLASDVRY